ncbi:MAG: VWA domain-containing protein, partial [Planctomycetaceae bacterium]|nr:VWA domain-containing protein [Planctomycetaceae bacterium]
PALVVPSFRLKGRMEFQLELTGPVREYQGVKNLRIPLPSTSWTQGPVDRLSVSTTIQAQKPVRAVFSPTHQINTHRKNLNSADVELRKEHAASHGDFRLCWVEDEDDLGLRMLTYRMEGEEDGYFLLLGNPTGRADGSDVVEKDVTFVLDTSGSMRGEKIEQCRAAIEYCLNHLNPKDRFNIVTFGTKVTPFRETLVANTPETVAAAQDFVEEIVAHGRTNINEALIQSLKGEPQTGRPRITIFLTDGTPTEGERLPEKILKAAQDANTSQSRIFVMGVGHDVNVHLLEKLAESTEGDSEFVDLEEEIDGKIASLYDRLAYPVLQHAKLDFGKLPVHSIFPRKVPALFRNNPVMLFGRYREGDKHTIKIQGELAGTPHEFVCKVDAPKAPQGLTNEFLAPLWATRKIGFLLQEIRLHGSDPELLKEIVRLSKKYGVITEYTEFVAQSGFEGGALAGAFAPMDAFREANRRLTMARDFDSGRWAFNQARNDKSLQSRLAVNEETNSFVDRAGRTVASESIRQVGGKAYYMRQGQWVDSTDNEKLKERVVELYSEDYFQLLRKNKDFARAQQLGWSVSVNLGNERIVVEKDGKRVDEELLKKSQQMIQQIPGRNVPQQQLRGLQNFQQNQFRGLNQLPLQNEFNRRQQIPNRRIDTKDKAPAPQIQEEQR